MHVFVRIYSIEKIKSEIEEYERGLHPEVHENRWIRTRKEEMR